MTDPVASTAEFRGSVVKREAPRALLWISGVVLLLAVYNAVLAGAPLWTDLMYLGVVAVFLAGARLAAWTRTRAVDMPWIVAACGVVVVLALEAEVWAEGSVIGMAYVLICMTAYAPFVLAPLAAGLAALPMVIGFVVVVRSVFPDDLVLWCGAGLAALLVGSVLLRVRLSGIDALGALTAQSRALATRDPLTGVFNRRGIEERIEGMASSAERREEPVFVIFVDINGLKRANDAHGHEFGDDLIRAAANALRGIVRASDVVGRWGGDEFVIVGTGAPMPTAALAQRIDDQLRASGIPQDMWSEGVSLGMATAHAADLDFADLVRRADRDMYERRGTVRGT